MPTRFGKVAVMCRARKMEGLAGARETGMSYEVLDPISAPIADTSVALGLDGDRGVTHLIVDDDFAEIGIDIALQAIGAGIETVMLSNDRSPAALRDAYIAVVTPGDASEIVKYLTIETRAHRLRAHVESMPASKSLLRQ